MGIKMKPKQTQKILRNGRRPVARAMKVSSIVILLGLTNTKVRVASNTTYNVHIFLFWDIRVTSNGWGKKQ